MGQVHTSRGSRGASQDDRLVAQLDDAASQEALVCGDISRRSSIAAFGRSRTRARKGTRTRSIERRTSDERELGADIAAHATRNAQREAREATTVHDEQRRTLECLSCWRALTESLSITAATHTFV